MNIQIQVKQLGKRKPIIENKMLDVPDLYSGTSLQIFLETIVKQQVMAFNSRVENPEVINFLLPKELETMVLEGKVGFKDTYNFEVAKVKEAQEVALLAFKDGLYKVFLDNNELEDLEDIIEFTEENTFTFIRLTFLAGGYY
ncbi:hypothetical protein SAMN04489761_3534 [Tenacibaculum sp. MAR_2009_124]|uniref:hypothetical protein n=1 Tax=Tenacibaculum sp. MAR_2009_124 TaxID=1250059 RepID=UPI00089D742A|nr:hypothetical protein [Tenacibaculum sp. MAR_2009_124]SEC77273.1 hypothetical protein SAMN04489761_3534 [Tenacibaculum sp. MAR_2009_124]